jgi:hypothetical protein
LRIVNGRLDQPKTEKSKQVQAIGGEETVVQTNISEPKIVDQILNHEDLSILWMISLIVIAVIIFFFRIYGVNDN